MSSKNIGLSSRSMLQAAAIGAAGMAISAGMGTNSASANPGQGDDSMLELVKKRRSIRKYTDQTIERATLAAILKIALFAPAGHGKKVVEFVVVEDKSTLDTLARCKRMGAPSVRAAAAAVVVIVDRNAELWIEDASVASTFLLLAAEQYGIGACWNHIRGRQGQKASADEEIRQLLDIPDRYTVLNIVALGHKGETKPAYTDADVSTQLIHYGKFAS